MLLCAALLGALVALPVDAGQAGRRRSVQSMLAAAERRLSASGTVLPQLGELCAHAATADVRARQSRDAEAAARLATKALDRLEELPPDTLVAAAARADAQVLLGRCELRSSGDLGRALSLFEQAAATLSRLVQQGPADDVDGALVSRLGEAIALKGRVERQLQWDAATRRLEAAQRTPRAPPPPRGPPRSVPRVSAAQLSLREFRKRYAVPGRPVVITDLVPLAPQPSRCSWANATGEECPRQRRQHNACGAAARGSAGPCNGSGTPGDCSVEASRSGATQLNRMRTTGGERIVPMTTEVWDVAFLRRVCGNALVDLTASAAGARTW